MKRHGPRGVKKNAKVTELGTLKEWEAQDISDEQNREKNYQ